MYFLGFKEFDVLNTGCIENMVFYKIVIKILIYNKTVKHLCTKQGIRLLLSTTCTGSEAATWLDDTAINMFKSLSSKIAEIKHSFILHVEYDGKFNRT